MDSVNGLAPDGTKPLPEPMLTDHHRCLVAFRFYDLPLDKMAAISQPTHSNTLIFVNENFCILIRIPLKFVPEGPINNNPALVQVMAWRRIGDKPLPEPMLSQFTDAYMRH